MFLIFNEKNSRNQVSLQLAGPHDKVSLPQDNPQQAALIFRHNPALSKAKEAGHVASVHQAIYEHQSNSDSSSRGSTLLWGKPHSHS